MRTGDVVGGRYELEDARGSGSGGVVWGAFDRKLKRRVALKRPHAAADRTDRTRFRREAETAAQVHHPNAISVFDTVDDHDECWLVMEFVSADSLDKLLTASGPLPPERVARIGLQVAAALAAVHAKKIIHRDVKPGNVLVGDGDLAKLTDFGISIWREVTRTDDGRISGTPAFAAPEVAGGKPAGEASDVFSLGATLFAAVEGTPPYGAGDAYEVLRRAREGETLPMAKAGPLAPLLAEMLAPRPGKRPTASQVRSRLKEIVGDWEPPAAPVTAERRPPRRRYWIGTAALVVAIIAATLYAANPWPGSGEAGAERPGAGGLIGDERTANPCALVDQGAWDRFGPAELHTTYGNFNRCDVLVDVGGREPVDVEVQLVTRKSHPVRGEPFEVVPEPSSADECDRTFLVDDSYGVRVTAKAPDAPADLCAMADHALVTVRQVVGEGRIARRNQPFPAGSLAFVDACGLLDDTALAALPAVDSSSAVGMFGGWGCKWYSAVDRVQVYVRYDQHATTDPVEGEEVAIGGHHAFVKLDADTGTSCTVSVLHQPPNRPRSTTVDLLKLSVRSDRPGEEYCPQATSLAGAAAANLPS